MAANHDREPSDSRILPSPRLTECRTRTPATGIANCDTKPISCRDPREDTHGSFGHSQMQRDQPTERLVAVQV